MYSVKELRDKIVEKVSGLGVDPKFRENPAYASAIAAIDNLIGQMNMFEEAENVPVQEENGNLSFSWTSPVGEKYSMSISCSNPESFRCVRTEEKRPYVGTNGQTVREKSIVEKVATIDKTSGFMTLDTNGAVLDNIDCSVGKCNNSIWAEKSSYTSNGIMDKKEYKGFPREELSEDFDRARIDSALYVPRKAFDMGMWYDRYHTRTLLVRDKLDTARLVTDDRTQGFRYNGIVPLNQEHGLRDMVQIGGFSPEQNNVVISPLSPEEIEKMIQRESNPKVQEGLRQYAAGRENYYYNSAEDKYFICEVDSPSQGMSK